MSVFNFFFLFFLMNLRIGSKSLELVLYEQWSMLPWNPPDCYMGTTKFNSQIQMAELLHTSDLRCDA